MTVFYHMSQHDAGPPQRSVSSTAPLPEATSDTLALFEASTWAVWRTWRDGFRYSQVA